MTLPGFALFLSNAGGMRNTHSSDLQSPGLELVKSIVLKAAQTSAPASKLQLKQMPAADADLDKEDAACRQADATDMANNLK